MADDHQRAHGVLTGGSGSPWWSKPMLGFFSGSPPCSAPVPDFLKDDGTSLVNNCTPPNLPPRPPIAHDDQFESAAALEKMGFGDLSPPSSTTDYSNSNSQQAFIIYHQQPDCSHDDPTTAATYALIQSLLQSDDDQLQLQLQLRPRTSVLRDRDSQYSVPCKYTWHSDLAPSQDLDHRGSTDTINNYTSSLNDILIDGSQDGNLLKPSLPSSATNLKTKKTASKVHELGSINATKSNKKARVEITPSPSPTFKVRKEKLGDRIAALQQLVSPFGKADTASVLHEAIEYIKFLHDQVNVFTTPYLKNRAPIQHQLLHHQGPHRDLRSRGLCLVPISFTFAVAHETPVDFWTPTLFETTTTTFR